RRRKSVSQQFVTAPVCKRDKKHQPHIGNGGFRVEKRLQLKCKNDGSPPAYSISANPRSPGEDRQSHEGSGDGGWKTRSEIVLAKNLVTGNLPPISKWRLVQPQLIIEIRHDVVAALDHFA